MSDRERWDARYADGAPDDPSPWLVSLAASLPTGRAIDIAGGGGRNALWLATRGWDPTLVDVSPMGLALARQRAAAAGVVLTTACRDLARQPLPPGPWDLAVVFGYLNRDVYRALPAALAPGGMIVIGHPTRTNLERHARPPARFLLEPGELPSLVPSVEIQSFTEDWNESDRHVARLVARRAD